MIYAVFFSPTGCTKRIVTRIADTLAQQEEICTIDYTDAAVRAAGLCFSREDLVVFGMPTYAGRVPNLIVKQMTNIVGNGARCVPVVTFGNRAFDDALVELCDLLAACGLVPVAAGAFVGAHSFSEMLGAGRPNEQDLQLADELALRALARRTSDTVVTVDGTPHPYRGYYQPRLADGTPIDIRNVKPKTNERCVGCGLCAAICPLQAIDAADPMCVSGICMKCCACVKRCPNGAKYFDDAGYLAHRHDLEEHQAQPKRSVIY